MNTALALANTLAAVAIAGRNPDWQEFENSSPADQRAIVARWREIVATNPKSLDDEWWNDNWPRAYGRLHRAHDQGQRRDNYDDAPLGGLQSKYENGCRTYGDQIGE